jgi:hypothetical protein
LLFVAAMNAQVPEMGPIEVLSATRLRKVDGVNGRGRTWEDSKAGTGLVLLVKATVNSDGQIWTPGFTLVYRREGKIGRARCVGVSTSTSGLDDEGAWLVGDYAGAPVRAGVRYFRLLFGVERGVTEVALRHARPVAGASQIPAGEE